MKKIYPFSIFILIPAIVLLLAFTTGPTAGYSGSPLDGQDCSSCHTPLPAGHVENWISTNIPPIGYTPGETYTVAVSALGMVAEKIGFQITSETQVAKTGLFIITDETRTQLRDLYTVTHTAAGTAVTGIPNTWTMDWTAPASGTGSVAFYAAVNVTDNDGSNSGDLIYVSALSVPESNIGIAELLEDEVGQIYPNPANQYINITLPLSSELKVYDNLGREIMLNTANSETMQIDVSGLDKGIYYMHIQLNGQFAIRNFIKK